MNRIICLWLLTISAGFASADESPAGYVLKAGEGEAVAGSLIKASPNTGTQNLADQMHELYIAWAKHRVAQAVAANPDLISSIVSETIRWQTPLAHMRRRATR